MNPKGSTMTTHYVDRPADRPDDYLYESVNRLFTSPSFRAALAASNGGLLNLDVAKYDVHHAFYVTLDGTPLILVRDNLKGRVEISTSHPEDRHFIRAAPRTRITVAADRDPEAIGKDIARRLLPAALEHRAEVEKLVAEKDEYDTNKATTIARIVDHPGVSNGIHHDKFSVSIPVGYVRGEITAPDYIDLELRGLDTRTALAVMDLLTGEGR